MMCMKVFIGSFLSYAFNSCVTFAPSCSLRELYLKIWLGSLGSKSGVQMGCRFLNGRKVYLGERNVINFGCLFDGRKFCIRTGSNVSIGPEASILTLGHDPRSATFEDRGGDVIIGDRVWIGYRAIVLPGITIGDGAVVGAGSVVTKSVAPYTIVAGNPATRIGQRFQDKSGEQSTTEIPPLLAQNGFTYELSYRPWLV